MCEACWTDEYGRSTDLPANGEDIADRIRLLYSKDGCGTGGPLHVQIDDFNIEGVWKPWSGGDYPNDVMVLAQQICDAMNPLTDLQRAAVLARWEGWF